MDNKKELDALAEYYVVLVNELKELQKQEQDKKREIHVVLDKAKELRNKIGI